VPTRTSGDVITLVDENMATVKQLGQSAHELAAQADALTGQVQRFMLPGKIAARLQAWGYITSPG